ncbi:putative integral membrane protein [Diplodia seriata]|uniref:Putative integral membrane protein n=1 Tax=Diplodia seriata TaxID=420778 RepID=A0A0G2DV47_9PEZI|nr:putative integral membrane protein [Diplodia seriata]
MVPNIALCISICLAERHGFDRHAWDLTADMAVTGRKLILTISILYLVSTGLTKVSILYFYRRIGEVRPWFKRTILVSIAFIIGYTLAFTLAMPLECTPTAAYWFKASPAWRMTHEYHCINEGAKMISAGVISAVQDFVACVLPMALFWDLRISRQAKFALGFVFSLGLITCTCGVIRTRFIYRVFFQTYDVTWAVRPALALTIMESCLGITCASMPALKSGLQRCFHVVIDPFTYGSSKSLSRRWKNPFFNSYQQSIQDYFDRSGGGGGGGGSRRKGGGYTPGLKVPPNTSAEDSGHSRLHKQSSTSKSVDEIELSTVPSERTRVGEV